MYCDTLCVARSCLDMCIDVRLHARTCFTVKHAGVPTQVRPYCRLEGRLSYKCTAQTQHT